MGKAFVYITLWYTKTTPGVFLCGVPAVLIPCDRTKLGGKYTMISCMIYLINTRTDMEVIWQLGNKNCNQCLIQKKDQNHYFWTYVGHFAIE